MLINAFSWKLETKNFDADKIAKKIFERKFLFSSSFLPTVLIHLMSAIAYFTKKDNKIVELLHCTAVQLREY